MAGIGARQAAVSAHLAVFMVVFVAFFCAHAADLLADRQIFVRDFRIPLNQS